MAAISAPIREPQDNAGLVLGLIGLILAGAVMGIGLAFGETDALVVCISVIGCAAVLYDFRVGAFLLCLMLPLGESALFPRAIFGIGGLNPINMVVVATVVSFLLHGRLRPRAGPIASKQLVLLYLLPMLFAGLLGARSADQAAPELYEQQLIHFLDGTVYFIEIVLKPAVIVLIALLVGAAVARSKKPEAFLIPIGVAIWLSCLLSISFVLRSSLTLSDIASSHEREFLSPVGLHANSLGRLYAVAYALLLFAWSESKSRVFRTACVATMGVVVLALVFTFSRGAFLGFLVVNALYLLWRFNMKTAAIVLLAAIVMIAVLPQEVYERASFGMDSDANAVSAGRLEGIWEPLMPEMLKSPVWGNGLGSIMWSEPMRHGQMNLVNHPHNAYIEIFLDLGLIGTLLVFAFYAHVWKGFRVLGSNAFLSPELRGFFKGAAAGLLAMFATGVAGSSFMPRPEYCFLWLAIGMMYGTFARRPAS